MTCDRFCDKQLFCSEPCEETRASWKINKLKTLLQTKIDQYNIQLRKPEYGARLKSLWRAKRDVCEEILDKLEE